jgi:hypothetical protein
MAHSDCFFIMGVALLLNVLGLFLMRKPRPGAPGRRGALAGFRPQGRGSARAGCQCG